MKDYYWIQPEDHTINGMENPRSKVLDAKIIDNKLVVSLEFAFEVGTIFHPGGSCQRYVVKAIKNDLRKFVVEPINRKWCLMDIRILKNKYIYKDGRMLIY